MSWVIELDGDGPQLYAAPWLAGAGLGQRNITHGDIDLSDDAAHWLYGNVAIGDRIQTK